MSEPMLAAASVDPRIGMVVQDRYRIIRKIGEGGMGAVYEGEHTVIKRRVAIKCLHAQYATNQEMVNRFHREAMAANAIRHANIVEVTDMGRFDDGGVFMVLELLDGRELSSVLRATGAMPLSRAVHIVSQVCDALQAAHEQNIVHRDLKPDNIYLCPRGDDDPDFVKVLDFGIAKFREQGHGQGMTRTGVTMGTPSYMAPEQAQASKDLDHRADIYSLGVILFHLVTGALPYDDESFPMLMVKVISHPAPRLRSVSPEAPQALDDLVDRMLAKNPALRPASCREVKAALQELRGVNTRFAAAQAPLGTRVGQASKPAAYSTPAGNLKTQTLGPPGSDPHVQAPPGSDPQVQTAPGSDPQVQAPGSHPQRVRSDYGSNPRVHAGSNPSGSAEVPRSRPPMALLGVALLVLGVSGALAFAFGSFGDSGARDEPPAHPRQDIAPAGPAPDPEPDPAVRLPVADTRPEPEAQPSPPPTAEQTVRVQIVAVPRDAELFLDGEPIANPFDADLPQTSTPRRLEARREGFQSHVQDLSLRFAQRVNIDLQRGTGVIDTRRTPPRRADTQRVDPTPTVTARPLDGPTTPSATPRNDPPASNPSTPGRDFIPIGI